MCLVNPVIGVVNSALSSFLSSLGDTSKILLSIVLAAMMATDMGGPFNKAAYVFGTAAIADGNTWIMAAVMIGGMVPPIAIALSTTFNKKKWTSEEIKSGPVNYLMGLCFITGGCYPLRRFRPGQSYPLMLSRLCCRRCSYIAVQRYMPRTSRRNLHIYSMRPSASLYRSPYCRLGCRSADARSS